MLYHEHALCYDATKCASVAYRTVIHRLLCHHPRMMVPGLPRTISAERLTGGVCITFSNGQEGFFSDEFLFTGLPDARARLDQELSDTPELPGASSSGDEPE